MGQLSPTSINGLRDQGTTVIVFWGTKLLKPQGSHYNNIQTILLVKLDLHLSVDIYELHMQILC